LLCRHYIRKEGGGDTLAKVDNFSFGSIIVDVRKYHYNLFLRSEQAMTRFIGQLEQGKRVAALIHITC
jgi:hypothetical protein